MKHSSFFAMKVVPIHKVISNTYILICCFIAFINHHASGHNYFKQYSIEDGLAQSQVYSIFQDSRSNLWVGTYGGGISKYDGKSFTNYTTKNGLSNDIVYCITEDQYGKIWFGTYGGGINIYNGINFSNILSNDTLGANEVYSIFSATDGMIWSGSSQGNLYLINPNNISQPVKLVIRQITNNIMAIYEDNKGNIWIGTEGNGVIMLNQDQLKKIHQNENIGNRFYHFTSHNGLSDNVVYSITQDHDGNLWFGTFGSGISILNSEELSLYKTDTTRKPEWSYLNSTNGLPDDRITCLYNDKDSAIWVGTYGSGVVRVYSRNDNHELKLFTETEGLGNNTVWAITQDRTGNIWTGTEGGGLNKFLSEAFIHYTTDDGLTSNIIYSIIEDNNSDFWFRTHGGGILQQITKSNNSKYTATENEFLHYSTLNGLGSNIVISLLKDTYGNIWAGSAQGVSVNQIDSKTGSEFTSFATIDALNSSSILCLYEDKEGNIWFGTDGGGAIKYSPDANSNLQATIYNTSNGLAHNTVWSIFEDSEGIIWIGTWGGGVSKIIGDDNSKTKYQIINISEKEGLNNNFVLSILEDKESNIWFGTYGGGINILHHTDDDYSIDTSSWNYITTNNGLSDDGVVSMTFDKNGNIWAGTNKGLNKIVFNNAESGHFSIKTYGKLEGFIGVECNQKAIYNDSKNNLWVGTANGLTKYNSKCDKSNSIEAQTHITDIRMFFNEVNWSQHADTLSSWYNLPENLGLNHNKNHLTFHFIGISLKIPEKVKYRYMLEGADNDWSPPVKETFATYPNISPGEYTFKVKACNDEGIWNKTPATFSFTVAPPFWQTWWFYLMSCLLGLGSIYSFYRIRIRILEKEKEKLEIIVDERTKELKEAYLNLEKLQDFKQSMMGMIVHDLKNPLGTILGFSKEQPTKYIMDNIFQSGRKMLNLILNILDVQKFEDAEVSLNLEDKNLYKVFSEAYTEVKILSSQKDVAIHNNIDKSIACKLDAPVIVRVFVNLLTNGIKYTPANGKITVDTEGVKDNGNNMIKILVSDTGKGIPADQVDKVFDQFSQMEAKESGGISSTGIGLAFCKMVVEAHNGVIGVESKYGQGTTFYFTLPVGGAKIEVVEDAPAQENEQEMETTEKEQEQVSLIFTDLQKQQMEPYLKKFK
ncbi:MAG: hypothetical protein JKY33_03065, partial [Bacteroidia bacterium]|nr:hypothetical protein [Bacteroidia bacterium]